MKQLRLKQTEALLRLLVCSVLGVCLLCNSGFADSVTVVSNISSVPQRLERKLNSAQLLKLLEHGDSAQRARAAFYLGQKRSYSTAVYRRLSHKVVHDQSKWVRRAAVKALRKIFGPYSRAAISPAIHDKDPYVVHSAKNALSSISAE